MPSQQLCCTVCLVGWLKQETEDIPLHWYESKYQYLYSATNSAELT